MQEEKDTTLTSHFSSNTEKEKILESSGQSRHSSPHEANILCDIKAVETAIQKAEDYISIAKKYIAVVRKKMT